MEPIKPKDVFKDTSAPIPKAKPQWFSNKEDGCGKRCDAVARIFGVFLLILIAAGGVYGFLFVQGQDYQLDGLRDAYSNASERIARVETELASFKRERAETTEAVPAEERKMFLPATIVSAETYVRPDDGRTKMPDDYRNCEEQGRPYQNPAVSIRYTLPDLGISLFVPYNPEWGTDAYYVDPVDVSKDRISFGEVFGRVEGCGSVREFSMIVRPYQSAEATLARTREESIQEWGDSDFADRTEIVSVSDKQVVVSYSAGLCDDISVELVGKTHNYLFQPFCGGGDDLRAVLLDIAQTAEFTE